MDHATAKAITNEYAPSLIVDDHNADIATVLVVRKVDGGMPFNVHLPSTLPGQFQDIPAVEATAEIPAVPASDDHPGHPAIPAQPARPGRTIAGQEAEAEKKMLTDALDAALKTLPNPPAA